MNMRNCCSSGMKCYGYGGLYPNYALCMSYCSSDYWEGAACNLLGSGSASTSFLQSNDEEDVDLSARGLQGPPAVPGRTSSEGPGSMIAPGLPEQKATAAGADETEQQHAPPHPAVPELLVVSSGENQEGVLLV
ncbi:unnamed protein product [Amoebophrya sp. A120]|nr:unnamed protein product [Amoebophrya sp. A120]|eukprot:GSA120T00007074001.1